MLSEISHQSEHGKYDNLVEPHSPSLGSLHVK